MDCLKLKDLIFFSVSLNLLENVFEVLVALKLKGNTEIRDFSLGGKSLEAFLLYFSIKI